MIRSRPSTDTYRENWDRIFGKPPARDAFVVVTQRKWTFESYDSHPAAD